MSLPHPLQLLQRLWMVFPQKLLGQSPSEPTKASGPKAGDAPAHPRSRSRRSTTSPARPSPRHPKDYPAGDRGLQSAHTRSAPKPRHRRTRNRSDGHIVCTRYGCIPKTSPLEPGNRCTALSSLRSTVPTSVGPRGPGFAAQSPTSPTQHTRQARGAASLSIRRRSGNRMSTGPAEVCSCAIREQEVKGEHKASVAHPKAQCRGSGEQRFYDDSG